MGKKMTLKRHGRALSQGGHVAVFYDRSCGICERAVQWAKRRDSKNLLHFFALQGEVADRTLVPLGLDPKLLDTVYAIANYGQPEREVVFDRAAATLLVLRRLGGPWKLARVLEILPTRLLDGAYNLFARNRHRFSKSSSCASKGEGCD